MEKERSEWLPITSSVVQGSILGPILFIIYINDLPDQLNNISKLYADDKKVLSKIERERDAQSFQQIVYMVRRMVIKIQHRKMPHSFW